MGCGSSSAGGDVSIVNFSPQLNLEKRK
jgi:hypothetical protein